jgi:predicted dehydrogenase
LNDITTSRRYFLKSSSTAVATATLVGSRAVTDARAAGANVRIRVGVIGCGGQGRGAHIGAFPAEMNAEIAYVCDPDAQRLADAAGLAKGAQPVADLRRILDDPAVDAVSIATPDHWHTPAAILAMEAGKHVYVEKPCSHNLREGRLLVEASQRTGRIVQHGTQARSNRGFQEAIEMLDNGVIGDVMIAKAWNVQRRDNIGHAQPSDVPIGFDYDTWVGPAPMMPFQSNRHHYNWHWWYNFGTGDLGNDGVHEIDMARWGLGVDTHPNGVAVVGGKYFFDDDQQFPDTVTTTFDYSGGLGERKQLIVEMRLWCTNYPEGVDSGIEFLGTKGTMFFSRRGKFRLLGERNKSLDQQPSEPPKMDVGNNLRAWLTAIRGDAPATAPASEAHLSASLCHLANIGVRVGRSLAFDGEHEQIVGDREANRLLAREYRDGHWAVPAGT